MEVIAKTNGGVIISATEQEVKEILRAVNGVEPKEIAIGNKIPSIDYATTITKVKTLKNNSDYTYLLRKAEDFNSTLKVLDYEDLRFQSSLIRRGVATAQPQYASFIGGTEILQFSATINQEAFIDVQLPHNRIDNSPLNPHFHWTPTNTNKGFVQWCIEYTCANKEDYFPETKIKCETDKSDGINNKHQITEYIGGNLTINNNLTSSAMCSMRIFRNATSISDNYTGLANLLEFDIHYQYYKLN